MARGWESKAIEAQQDAARDRVGASSPGSHSQTFHSAERDTFILARQKALADLQRACAPNHRAMLERAIADLDARIARLGRSGPVRSVRL